MAETALKHYAEADKYFAQVDDQDEAVLRAEEQKALKAPDSLLTALRQLTTDRRQRAQELQLNLQYHDATGRLESAANLVAGDLKRYPDDKALRGVWLDAAFAVAKAHLAEGEVAPASHSLPLLAQAADDYQTLARAYLASGDKANWAATQIGLGNSLINEGERASGEKSFALLDQAVEAYRSALEVYTKADLPQDWARTQNNLGNALMEEGERAGGDKAVVLLDQAVQAYRSALEVLTKAHIPQDWATTQNNLGNALLDEGQRARSDKAAALFDQAVQAHRRALEVYTKADTPQDWATTQNNLGVALMDEGQRAGSDKAAALFDQAVQAYRSALEVNTKADLPQDWAMTQNNLGIALVDEGARAGSDKAVALFDQAVQAYRSALEVRTKADLPQDWARTQINLSHIYHEVLFRFDRALELDVKRMELEPNSGNYMALLEAYLTANQFDTCAAQAAKGAEEGITSKELPVHDVIQLACEWASGNRVAALAHEQSLAAQTAGLSESSWNFTGTLHFLAESPAFASGRASWIALFTSVQNGDAAGMTKALHDLEPLMNQ